MNSSLRSLYCKEMIDVRAKSARSGLAIVPLPASEYDAT